MTEVLLVTGSTGFIASHFLDLIEQDKHYIVKRFVGNITRREDCVRNLRDVDTVINFAALTYLPPSWSNPDAYTRVNYQGVVNLLESHTMFKKFVQISTSHVYGTQVKIPISLFENEPRPHDPYSIAKLAAERAVESYAHKYGFQYLIIRPFNNFGPRQSHHFVIPSFILQALENGRIVVRGNSRREFVYVKDNVRRIKWLLDGWTTGYAQICKDESYQILDVALKIAELVGTHVKVDLDKTDRPFDIPELRGVPFPVFPFEWTPMEQALKETVEYYKLKFTPQVAEIP